MARHGRVSVYRRDSSGKYHRCDPRGVYSRDTTFVLRYEAERGRRVWEKLLAGTDHTAARRKALERELALTGTPSLSKAPVKHKPVPGLTRIRDASDAYIDALWAEGNLDPKTIKGKRFELNRWVDWVGKQHVEELERADMIAFRDRLREAGKAEWTVESNMMTVVTMLKHNPPKPTTGLLKPADWPDIEDTEPRPYEVEEVKALQSVATEDEKLLIRFFVGTGMRDMEVAHLEWSDFNWAEKTVWVHAKPQYKWKPKTKAGTRKIPVSDSLLRDLKARKGEGLAFPAPRGGVDKHYLRVMQELGEKAGVKDVGLHRFRDTYITDMVRGGVDLLTLRKWVGHENLETLKLYAEALRAKDQRARDAANRQDCYTLRDAVAAD
jgi:integrase